MNGIGNEIIYRALNGPDAVNETQSNNYNYTWGVLNSVNCRQITADKRGAQSSDCLMKSEKKMQFWLL